MKTWRHVRPTARGWEPFREAFLAECSLEAYDHPVPPQPRIAEAFGPSLRRFDVSAGLQGFCGWTDSFAVLAFRGTDEMADWELDVRRDLVVRHWCHGRVHRGFSETLNIGWARVAHLVSLIPAGLPLLVTGHSLGGALAVLAAARLRAEGIEVAHVATFGQPRVGDRRFCRFSGPPSWRRVALGGDPVVSLPPAPKLLRRYAHGGEFAWLDEGRLDLSLFAPRLHAGASRLHRVRDHSAEAYSLAMDALLPRIESK